MSQSKRSILRRIHLVGFIYTVSTALIVYVESSFLQGYVKPEAVGSLYTIGYCLAIAGMLSLSILVREFGKRKTFTMVYALLATTLLLLSIPLPAPIAIVLFFILTSVSWIVVMGMDLALEQYSNDESTGRTRGRFLTAMNFGWIVAPLIMGVIADHLGIRSVFLFSGLVLVPALFIFPSVWKSSDDHRLHHQGALVQALRDIISHPGLWRITAIAFIHEFFFAIMMIYLPLYLREGIGLSWSTIGIIFFVMLLPFVLFEFAAGRLADEWLGEKELLVGAMILMGVATIAVGRIATIALLPWMIWLFLTRTGASVIESMRDSYFYKHVDSDDVATILIFHAAWLLAYVVGPLVGTAVLSVLGYAELFQIVGGIILISTLVLIGLPDTK